MRRAEVKRRLIVGAFALLVLIAGVADAAALPSPGPVSWVTSLWGDLGRTVRWLAGTLDGSEVPPPADSPESEPEPSSPPEVEPSAPRTESEISPMVDPDG